MAELQVKKKIGIFGMDVQVFHQQRHVAQAIQ
jgi:hypothetical protein